jgi:hypothetical protein
MGAVAPGGDAAMTTKALAAALLILMTAGAAAAQEPEPEPAAEPEQDEAAQPDTRRPLRVLENPYDISSFYRSSDSGPFLMGPEGASSERYPIAGFYRQRPGGRGYGYSQFWTTGYGDRGRGRARLGIGYRRAIGENGDLFLFAPAFLAPIGPLTGVFFSDSAR